VVAEPHAGERGDELQLRFGDSERAAVAKGWAVTSDSVSSASSFDGCRHYQAANGSVFDSATSYPNIGSL
jgi:hypothetical protein